MNETDFINKSLDVPWVNRGMSFDGMDCYGLVILYYRLVLGIELPMPSGYIEKEPINECWDAETGSGRWAAESRPIKNGIVLTAYRGDTPIHVGVVVSGGRLLHCRGNENEPGKVEIHRISAIEKIYGRVTYHSLRDLNA